MDVSILFAVPSSKFTWQIYAVKFSVLVFFEFDNFNCWLVIRCCKLRAHELGLQRAEYTLTGRWMIVAYFRAVHYHRLEYHIFYVLYPFVTCLSNTTSVVPESVRGHSSAPTSEVCSLECFRFPWNGILVWSIWRSWPSNIFSELVMHLPAR
jgi:hypothetical protein